MDCRHPWMAAARASGAVPEDQQALYFPGDAARYQRPGMSVTSPLLDGTVRDWDLWTTVVEHGLDVIGADSTTVPMLIAEPAMLPDGQRASMLEHVFERLEAPAGYLARAPCLTALGMGRPSALVIDIGAEHTRVSAVLDGIMFKLSCLQSSLGVNALLEYLPQAMETDCTRAVPTYSVHGLNPVVHARASWGALAPQDGAASPAEQAEEKPAKRATRRRGRRTAANASPSSSGAIPDVEIHAGLRKGCALTVPVQCSVPSVQLGSAGEPSGAPSPTLTFSDVVVDDAGTTASYVAACQRAMAEDVLRSIGRVNSLPYDTHGVMRARREQLKAEAAATPDGTADDDASAAQDTEEDMSEGEGAEAASVSASTRSSRRGSARATRGRSTRSRKAEPSTASPSPADAEAAAAAAAAPVSDDEDEEQEEERSGAGSGREDSADEGSDDEDEDGSDDEDEDSDEASDEDSEDDSEWWEPAANVELYSRSGTAQPLHDKVSAQYITAKPEEWPRVTAQSHQLHLPHTAACMGELLFNPNPLFRKWYSNAPSGLDSDLSAKSTHIGLTSGSSMAVLRLSAAGRQPPRDLYPSTLGGTTLTVRPIQDMVQAVLRRVDPELRATLAANILLTGGGSLIRGLKERLSMELEASIPSSFHPRLYAPGRIAQANGAWIGGSVLSTLGTFQQLWISKAEWEEEGGSILHRRCL